MPSARRKTPPDGIGIIITPDAWDSRRHAATLSPSACRSSSSSNPARAPVGSVERQRLAHRPPIGRAAISSTKTPRSLTRHSAWIGPCVKPERRGAVRTRRAAHGPASRRSAATASRRSSPRRTGPSSGSGLSKIASVRSRPSSSTPSSAYSGPSMNCSTMMSHAAASCSARTSADISSRRRRSKRATNSSGESARITPRLPESDAGFTTTGHVSCAASLPGSTVSGTT